MKFVFSGTEKSGVKNGVVFTVGQTGLFSVEVGWLFLEAILNQKKIDIWDLIWAFQTALDETRKFFLNYTDLI